ncbi:response regulator [Clostridium sp. CX1]|uniref:Stage 0 sporulation protein A homolog n=1 Tax=Clostridium tanneri TaxID=3037988 RepID=A0ABU4JU73_9CLOT|nr:MULTISPECIES: response regulator [unclassified Clostridium]MCT8977090.1 response regulator [Clostridium sp. CX1]MDW8801705.1 response regulator [Clostridium sp. A1-XYC3]
MGVLIVDDSKFMRNIIIEILEKNNIKVSGEASNGREAVTKYKELKPTVVTMDLTMREMTGLEAVKEIIKIDSKAYVIVCSAMGQQQIIREAIEEGAKGFVIKPFDEDELLKEINKAFKLKG